MKLPANVISALIEADSLFVGPGQPDTLTRTQKNRLRRLEVLCQPWWDLRVELADLVHKEEEEPLTEGEVFRRAELCEMFRDWPGCAAQKARDIMGLI